MILKRLILMIAFIGAVILGASISHAAYIAPPSTVGEAVVLIDADTKKVVDNIIYLLPEPEVQMQQMREAQGGKPLSPLAQKAAYGGGIILVLLFALYLYHEHKHKS